MADSSAVPRDSIAISSEDKGLFLQKKPDHAETKASRSRVGMIVGACVLLAIGSTLAVASDSLVAENCGHACQRKRKKAAAAALADHGEDYTPPTEPLHCCDTEADSIAECKAEAAARGLMIAGPPAKGATKDFASG